MSKDVSVHNDQNDQKDESTVIINPIVAPPTLTNIGSNLLDGNTKHQDGNKLAPIDVDKFKPEKNMSRSRARGIL